MHVQSEDTASATEKLEASHVEKQAEKAGLHVLDDCFGKRVLRHGGA